MFSELHLSHIPLLFGTSGVIQVSDVWPKLSVSIKRTFGQGDWENSGSTKPQGCQELENAWTPILLSKVIGALHHHWLTKNNVPTLKVINISLTKVCSCQKRNIKYYIAETQNWVLNDLGNNCKYIWEPVL